MPQKNSDQFDQLGTKIDPAMAEVLNAVCDSLTNEEAILNTIKQYENH